MAMLSRQRYAKKSSFAAAAVAVTLMLGAGQALAHSGDTFHGYEIPSEHVTLSQGQPQCATFHADPDDPTTHVLNMHGDFLDVNHGDGTATLTIEDAWYAGPEGTYTSATCGTQGTVTGDMVLVFENWSCTGTGVYERRNFDEYTLEFTGTCDDTDTTGTVETEPVTVIFVGEQVLCPTQGCSEHVDAGTSLDGVYTQS